MALNKDSFSTRSTCPVTVSSAVAVLICASLAFLLGHRAVMPLPIAAGVLGMVRMMGCVFPNNASKEAIDFPAAMERMRVCASSFGLRLSQTLSMICGLTARMAISGVVIRSSALLRPVTCSYSVMLAGIVAGSMIVMWVMDGSLTQLSSMACPIFPQPTSRICVPCELMRLGLSNGFHEGKAHRLVV